MIVKLRKMIVKVFPVLAILLLAAFVLSRVFTPERTPAPEISISANEAQNHAGTPAEVCGEVASTSFLEHIDGKPTFLNFERPHPDQVFTVVIWGEHRSLWQQPPDQLYHNRFLCVTGRIDEHDGVPQIVVSSPDQTQLQ
jgi:hypothetical protein